MDEPTTTQVVVTRVFDAPREEVFRAFIEPERIQRWWGPANFTAPAIQVDPRPGGKYLYCMRSPDGQDFWSTGVFKEIVPPERVVYTDSFADEHGNVVPSSYYGMEGIPLELLVTVSFEDLGGQTRVRLTHDGVPAGEHATNTELGWNQSLDKFAQALNGGKKHTLKAEPGQMEIVMTREFDAPVELVSRLWMDPKLVPQWWGPADLKTRVEKMEVTPGGRWRFVQTDPQGNEYGFHGVYHDVTTTRVVQTFEYEGMVGHVSLETIFFEPLEGNRTRVVDQSLFQSVADRDGMLASGMESGAAELFDRLEKLLLDLTTQGDP